MTQPIDSAAWPHIATAPDLRFSAFRTRKAEAAFARACQAGDLNLHGDDPDLRVHTDSLFRRIAAGGWLGLAEGYMAGEWSTPDSSRLVVVLTALLRAGYSPKTPSLQGGEDQGGEIPYDLVRLYSPDGVSHQGGIFSTGVPTTMREEIPAQGTHKHFVDIKTLSAPTAVDRDDLGYAQERAADWLLDAAGVTAGSHLLVYPATGSQAAVRAAGRRAVVDLITSDPDAQTAVCEYLVLAGVADSVHVQLVDVPVAGPKQWRGRYDAVVSVEKLEHLSPDQRKVYLRAIDRWLAVDGRAVIQSTVATERLTTSARDAMAVLRAYVWPGLNVATAADVNYLCESETQLRVIAQAETGDHYRESLQQQRSFFDGHLREAAAAGYDPVYRRLWTYQFALRESLFALGMLDSVHFSLVHRNRGGRR